MIATRSRSGSTTAIVGGTAVLTLFAACQERSATPVATSTGQAITDAVHEVLSADRATYTEMVVHRLQDQEKVMKASENWKEEKLLPLPAQMFRMSAERTLKRGTGLSYALVSAWPINKQNAPRTEVEREGLQALAAQPQQRFGREEKLGDKRYFTAIYPDTAVSQACINCHNAHPESPRSDFRLGDVMGAIVIRVAQN
jgi:hypothetical protein